METAVALCGLYATQNNAVLIAMISTVSYLMMIATVIVTVVKMTV
jgi:hypothetical protein